MHYNPILPTMRRLRTYLIFVGVATAVIMLLGLVVNSSTHTGWTDPGSFSIDVTRLEMGVPHWLVVNSVRAKGNAPPIDPRYLPEAEQYRPGWHVRPGAWLISLGGRWSLRTFSMGMAC